MGLPVIDIVFMCAVLFFAIVGLVKGVVDLVFNWAAPVISVWTGMLFYRRVGAFLRSYIASPTLASVAGFLAVFVAVFIVIKVVQLLLGNLFEGKVLGQLNRLLGLALGAAEGAAVVLLVLVAVHAVVPARRRDSLLAGSVFNAVLGRYAEVPAGAISSALGKAGIRPAEVTAGGED